MPSSTFLLPPDIEAPIASHYVLDLLLLLAAHTHSATRYVRLVTSITASAALTVLIHVLSRGWCTVPMTIILLLVLWWSRTEGRLMLVAFSAFVAFSSSTALLLALFPPRAGEDAAANHQPGSEAKKQNKSNMATTNASAADFNAVVVCVALRVGCSVLDWMTRKVVGEKTDHLVPGSIIVRSLNSLSSVVFFFHAFMIEAIGEGVTMEQMLVAAKMVHATAAEELANNKKTKSA